MQEIVHAANCYAGQGPNGAWKQVVAQQLGDTGDCAVGVLAEGRVPTAAADPVNAAWIESKKDPVNPAHYRSHPSGVECIQVTEHMNFNRGNAVKYIWRAGEKGDAIEDLKKARWYLDREIARLSPKLTIADVAKATLPLGESVERKLYVYQEAEKFKAQNL